MNPSTAPLTSNYEQDTVKDSDYLFNIEQTGIQLDGYRGESTLPPTEGCGSAEGVINPLRRRPIWLCEIFELERCCSNPKPEQMLNRGTISPRRHENLPRLHPYRSPKATASQVCNLQGIRDA